MFYSGPNWYPWKYLSSWKLLPARHTNSGAFQFGIGKKNSEIISEKLLCWGSEMPRIPRIKFPQRHPPKSSGLEQSRDPFSFLFVFTLVKRSIWGSFLKFCCWLLFVSDSSDIRSALVRPTVGLVHFWHLCYFFSFKFVLKLLFYLLKIVIKPLKER